MFFYVLFHEKSQYSSLLRFSTKLFYQIIWWFDFEPKAIPYGYGNMVHLGSRQQLSPVNDVFCYGLYGFVTWYGLIQGDVNELYAS